MQTAKYAKIRKYILRFLAFFAVNIIYQGIPRGELLSGFTSIQEYLSPTFFASGGFCQLTPTLQSVPSKHIYTNSNQSKENDI